MLKADLACPNGCIVLEAKGDRKSCTAVLGRSEGACPQCGDDLVRQMDISDGFELIERVPTRRLEDPNLNLSDRSAYLSREMTTWSYSALADLFEDDEEYALYMREADHKAVFFHAHGRCWLMVRTPAAEMSKVSPELVEDWLGSLAPKEPGAEPVLMHRDELPKDVKAMVDHVETVEPEHPYETFGRVTGEQPYHDKEENQ